MEQSKDSSKNVSTPFTLLDVISIFLKNKKKIFLVSLFFCIVSIILYFFVFDLIYKSTASIRSSSKSGGLLGALESGIPDIGGLDDLGLSGGSKSAKELAAYEDILYSRRCIEVIVKKFELLERDDYLFLEDAVKSFREEQLQVEIDKMSGTMRVSVLDKNPQFAKEMVETLLDELNKINIELSITNARNNRQFIENRYILAREDLAKAEDSLKSFQLIYGIAPDLQIKAAAQSVFALEGELKAEEVKLDVMKQILSADEPEVKTQTTKINSLKNKISEISTSTDLSDFLRLGNSPQIALQFLRLQREMEIQSKILAFVLPLYEQAKIDEKRETPTILILDSPVVSERKTKPKRLTMVLLISVMGILSATIFYIVQYKWQQFKLSNRV